MRIDLTNVRKGSRRSPALPETTLAFESGRASVAYAETERRPTVLGLLASGRMRPDAGTVTLNGRRDYRTIRRRIALVDAPDVSAPEDDVSVLGVTAEQLMFAGRPSDPFAVRRWLDELGLGELGALPMNQVAPGARFRLLCEAAVLRTDTDGFVLVTPDRHGGEPHEWWAIAQEFAGRGYAVLVIAGRASQELLPLPAQPATDDAAIDLAIDTLTRIAPLAIEAGTAEADADDVQGDATGIEATDDVAEQTEEHPAVHPEEHTEQRTTVHTEEDTEQHTTVHTTVHTEEDAEQPPAVHTEEHTADPEAPTEERA